MGFQLVFCEWIPSGLRLPFLTTRTWSTNGSHIHILTSLGFEVSERVVNHHGEGIDTVYFGKAIAGVSSGF